MRKGCYRYHKAGCLTVKMLGLLISQRSVVLQYNCGAISIIKVLLYYSENVGAIGITKFGCLSVRIVALLVS